MTREEAIKIVRNIYQTDAEKEALATLIPELAESEDERIIKAISYAICEATHQDGTLINDVTRDEAVAYLERQKEQKPASTVKSKFKSGDSIRFNGFGSNEYTIQLVGNGYYVNSEGGRMDMSYTDANFVLIEEPKPVEWEWPNLSNCIKNCKKCHGKCFYRKESYEEQKPAEKLSKEEYVKKFKALCNAYEIKLPNREYDIYGLCEDLHKLFGDIQKPVEWSEDTIRKAIEEVGLTQHQINWFKNNVFPPKQEWSKEEKERIRQSGRLDVCYNPEKYGLCHKTEWGEGDIKKIRSEEYTKGFNDAAFGEKAWKPSEEQMEALNEIINTLAVSKHPHENDYLFNILNGLRKNLKSL